MLSCESLQAHSLKEAMLFQRLVRIPYLVFMELMELMKCFVTREKDAEGREGISVKLKVNFGSSSSGKIEYYSILL